MKCDTKGVVKRLNNQKGAFLNLETARSCKKLWHPRTKLHGVTTQMTVIFISSFPSPIELM
jgi:hypothetical protein